MVDIARHVGVFETSPLTNASPIISIGYMSQRLWTKEEDELLGTMLDREVAKLIGRTLRAVIKRRWDAGKRTKHINTVEEFWRRVHKGDGPNNCWMWIGGKDPNGYGNFSMHSKQIKSHRFSWELAHGTINDRHMQVCHRCDNPSCVNPKHLFLGTNSDNQRDAVKKLRKRSGGIHHNAKLDGSKVREIRKLLGCGLSQYRIAEMFAISRGSIANIAQGRTWNIA